MEATSSSGTCCGRGGVSAYDTTNHPCLISLVVNLIDPASRSPVSLHSDGVCSYHHVHLCVSHIGSSH